MPRLTEPEVRDALAHHFLMWHKRPDGDGPPGEWRCGCGLKFGFSDTAINHQARVIDATQTMKAARDEAELG